MDKYQPVIGLEIHVELKTKSKMFCQCNANYFGKEPNTQTCPVCLGLPGALPVPNKKAVEYCQMIGAALNCQLATQSKFDRKHYFYPDLPKGYQISQYDEPFCTKGQIEISEKKIGITRVHMEEDTGKLIHDVEETLIDFNRSGVPLVEIVTEPDFDNAADVKFFLEELQVIIRYLGVSDADMEKGSMRLEPNISLKLKGEKNLPKYKVEVKNINSFNFVKKAVEYEIIRQSQLLEKGKKPEQETRGFNENKGITISQRSKEYAHDYRYFPDPDIPPLEFAGEYLSKRKGKLPELPTQKMARYVKKLGLRQQDAFILTRSKTLADYFDDLCSRLRGKEQQVANTIVNKKIQTNLTVEEFIKEFNSMTRISTVTDEQMKKVVEEVIKKNAKAIKDYTSGKENVLMFLVGQVMRELKGQADAKKIREELQRRLK